jgi:hypothetical protein
MLTLENYIEKYMPLQNLRIMFRVIRKCFDEKNQEKLDKHINRFALEMQENILTDLGKGSIFENIIKHNQHLIDQLKI